MFSDGGSKQVAKIDLREDPNTVTPVMLSELELSLGEFAVTVVNGNKILLTGGTTEI